MGVLHHCLSLRITRVKVLLKLWQVRVDIGVEIILAKLAFWINRFFMGGLSVFV